MLKCKSSNLARLSEGIEEDIKISSIYNRFNYKKGAVFALIVIPHLLRNLKIPAYARMTKRWRSVVFFIAIL
jgi:hypothetical protein